MANDTSNFIFNVLALEDILVALTREIRDGPCFLYLKFSWIGVRIVLRFSVLIARKLSYVLTYYILFDTCTNMYIRSDSMKPKLY